MNSRIKSKQGRGRAERASPPEEGERYYPGPLRGKDVAPAALSVCHSDPTPTKTPSLAIFVFLCVHIFTSAHSDRQNSDVYTLPVDTVANLRTAEPPQTRGLVETGRIATGAFSSAINRCPTFVFAHANDAALGYQHQHANCACSTDASWSCMHTLIYILTCILSPS